MFLYLNWKIWVLIMSNWSFLAHAKRTRKKIMFKDCGYLYKDPAGRGDERKSLYFCSFSLTREINQHFK